MFSNLGRPKDANFSIVQYTPCNITGCEDYVLLIVGSSGLSKLENSFSESNDYLLCIRIIE